MVLNLHCQIEWNEDCLGDIPLSVPVMMFLERFSYMGMTYPKVLSQGLGSQNEEVEKDETGEPTFIHLPLTAP